MNCPEASKGERAHIIALNRDCYCLPLERPRIDTAILSSAPVPGLGDELESRANLFAGTAVFVSWQDMQAMLSQIAALESVWSNQTYLEHIEARTSSPTFSVQSGSCGLFMGYDFHITHDGPRLIEVNTNAGGAFLIGALKAGMDNDNQFSELACAAVLSEWQRAGRAGRPQTLAIVDETPAQQYLYPDMLIACQMFKQIGINVVIIDPAELTFDGKTLTCGHQVIDMVYNRLTDFSLEKPAAASLRAALLVDAAVISPAPRHHALQADKRNLALLSDPEFLEELILEPQHAEALSSLPATRLVVPEDADDLWKQRKQYFFKPANGFGSRATYRGAKLTRRVWSDILSSNYVAQAYIAPTVRGVKQPGGGTEMKFDVRIYAYAGRPLLAAARVYRGQTTNFRTPGGGLAPVICDDAPFTLRLT